MLYLDGSSLQDIFPILHNQVCGASRPNAQKRHFTDTVFLADECLFIPAQEPQGKLDILVPGDFDDRRLLCIGAGEGGDHVRGINAWQDGQSQKARGKQRASSRRSGNELLGPVGKARQKWSAFGLP